MRALVCALVIASGAAAAGPAFAGPAQDGRDSPAAEALFEEARLLLLSKRYAEACAKLEMSQRLDPGTGTLLNLGRCLEAMGRTASAWARFREAAASAAAAGQREREQEARARAAALEPRLAYLTVHADQDGAQPAALIVRRDDVLLERGLWGAPLPIDPGEHTIEATSDGYEPRTIVVRVEGDASRRTVVIPPLEPRATPTPRGSAPPTRARERSVASGAGLGAQRTLGIVAGGAAAASVIVGTVLAVRAKSLSDEAHDACTSAGCPGSAYEKNDDAGTLADGASVAFLAGGVFAVSSLVLFLTAPSAVKTPVSWRRVQVSVSF